MEKKNFDLVIEIMKQGVKLARARPAAGRGVKKAKAKVPLYFIIFLS